AWGWGGVGAAAHRPGTPPTARFSAIARQPPRPRRAVGARTNPRRARGIGPRQRNDLAAGVLAERRDEDRSPVITPDDANSDHRRVSVGRRSGPASQARVGAPT